MEYNEAIATTYKKFHPNDTVIIGDAHQYLLDHYEEYDFIWGSPPCQSHSRMMKATRHDVRKYPDMALYQEIIFVRNFFKGKWLIENVKPYYEPLINPSIILGRHYFWSNFIISQFNIQSPKEFIDSTSTKGAEMLKEWLGINYEGNLYYEGNHCPGQVLRNCVHPEMGLHILDCARGIMRKKNEKQIEMFNQ